MPLLLALTLVTLAAPWSSRDGIVAEEFVYESAPFAQCHASTIVELPGDGGRLVAAWFGGTREGASDVGIWVARKVDGQWTAPALVANGVQSPDERFPCWNPVLFQPRDGKAPLMLFYKVGPSPRAWWGMLMTSTDGGATWTKPRRLPDGVLGPIKNKPIQLSDGAILSGTSTEHDGWRVHFERSTDLGATWSKTDPINDGQTIGAIQPSILTRGGDSLLALGRSRQGQLWQATSSDAGKTWSAMTLTKLPNPNAGSDAVTLADGRHLLVYNHTGGRSLPADWPRGREMLNVAMSKDGEHWQAAIVLESSKGEYSYPAVIQTRDGLVHITYTWRRQRVRHVTLDPAKLTPRDMPDGQWPQ